MKIILQILPRNSQSGRSPSERPEACSRCHQTSHRSPCTRVREAGCQWYFDHRRAYRAPRSRKHIFPVGRMLHHFQIRFQWCPPAGHGHNYLRLCPAPWSMYVFFHRVINICKLSTRLFLFFHQFNLILKNETTVLNHVCTLCQKLPPTDEDINHEEKDFEAPAPIYLGNRMRTGL